MKNFKSTKWLLLVMAVLAISVSSIFISIGSNAYIAYANPIVHTYFDGALTYVINDDNEIIITGISSTLWADYVTANPGQGHCEKTFIVPAEIDGRDVRFLGYAPTIMAHGAPTFFVDGNGAKWINSPSSWTLPTVDGLPFSAAPIVGMDGQGFETVIFKGAMTALTNAYFTGCTTLREVVFMDDIISLRQGIFGSLSALEQIHFHGDVGLIADSAFSRATDWVTWGDDYLETITFAGNVGGITGGSFSGRGHSLDKLIFQGNVGTIQDGAFSISWGTNDLNIRHIEFKKDAQVITNGAFQNVPNLETLIFRGVAPHTINNGAFQNSAITDLFLPNGVNYIGGSAFSDSAIENIHFGGPIQALSWSSLTNTQVKRFMVPYGTQRVQGALGGEALESIFIPSTVTDLSIMWGSAGSSIPPTIYTSLSQAEVDALVLGGDWNITNMLTGLDFIVQVDTSYTLVLDWILDDAKAASTTFTPSQAAAFQKAIDGAEMQQANAAISGHDMIQIYFELVNAMHVRSGTVSTLYSAVVWFNDFLSTLDYQQFTSESWDVFAQAMANIYFSSAMTYGQLGAVYQDMLYAYSQLEMVPTTDSIDEFFLKLIIAGAIIIVLLIIAFTCMILGPRNRRRAATVTHAPAHDVPDPAANAFPAQGADNQQPRA